MHLTPEEEGATSPVPQDPDELFRAAKEPGNYAALRAFAAHITCDNELKHLAMRLLNLSNETVEDILGDYAEFVLEKPKNLWDYHDKPMNNYRAFMLCVITYMNSNRQRKATVRRIEPDDYTRWVHAIHPDDDPAAPLIAREDAEWLRAASRLLPPSLQRVLSAAQKHDCFRWNGAFLTLDSKRLAKLLRVPEGRIRVYWHRAVEGLCSLAKRRKGSTK